MALKERDEYIRKQIERVASEKGGRRKDVLSKAYGAGKLGPFSSEVW